MKYDKLNIDCIAIYENGKHSFTLYARNDTSLSELQNELAYFQEPFDNEISIIVYGENYESDGESIPYDIFETIGEMREALNELLVRKQKAFEYEGNDLSLIAGFNCDFVKVNGQEIQMNEQGVSDFEKFMYDKTIGISHGMKDTNTLSKVLCIENYQVIVGMED